MEAQIYHFKAWITAVEPPILEARLASFLEQAGYQVLDSMQHHFRPHGYTAIWLLAESHLAVHTFPEANKPYIELSSCSQEKQERFVGCFGEIFPS